MGLVMGAAIQAGAADPKTAGMMDPKAMMEKMQKYGAPGVHHEPLAASAGRWTSTVKSWMKPGDPPMESKGTSENTMVLSGRYMQQTFKGDMNGMPFEGIGYTGYDTIRGEYQSVWMDSMVTGMMIGAGQSDTATKTIKQTGTFSCPMTGEKAMWYRTEWKMIDNDNQTFTMYAKGPDGKEVKAMEIVYKRVK
jgi:hypothetical protein